ncbi:MAG: Flp family type IVb pilin [Actinomycetes bacterium]|jgi:Flp pilus assembly pilin Flp
MFKKLAKALKRNDQGASLVEYALLVLLIAILGFVAVQGFGQSVGATYDHIASELNNAASGS